LEKEQAAQAWRLVSRASASQPCHKEWISEFHMVENRKTRRIKAGEEIVWGFAFMFDLSMYLTALYST